MMRNLLIAFWFLLLRTGVASHAQDSSRVAAMVTFAPLMLLDPENTLTLGLEVPFSKNWSVRQEVGWGGARFNLWSSQRERYPDRTTRRYRTQLRWYYSGCDIEKGSSYLAAEYFRKDVWYSWIGQQCNATGTCAYFQQTAAHVHRKVWAANFKYGYLLVLSGQMILDVYMSVGLRQLIEISNGAPVNTDFNPFLIRRRMSRNYEIIPYLSGGFSLAYAFRKKTFKTLPMRL